MRGQCLGHDRIAVLDSSIVWDVLIGFQAVSSFHSVDLCLCIQAVDVVI